MERAGDFDAMPKKEALRHRRELEKLRRNLGGIRDLDRLPDAIFVIDTKKEHIAVTEANKLGMPIVAVVDTNCDPDVITHVIPGNDDAIRSGALMCRVMAEAVVEGRFVAEHRAATAPAPAPATAPAAAAAPSRRRHPPSPGSPAPEQAAAPRRALPPCVAPSPTARRRAEANGSSRARRPRRRPQRLPRRRLPPARGARPRRRRPRRRADSTVAPCTETRRARGLSRRRRGVSPMATFTAKDVQALRQAHRGRHARLQARPRGDRRRHGARPSCGCASRAMAGAAKRADREATQGAVALAVTHRGGRHRGAALRDRLRGQGRRASSTSPTSSPQLVAAKGDDAVGRRAPMPSTNSRRRSRRTSRSERWSASRRPPTRWSGPTCTCSRAGA